MNQKNYPKAVVLKRSLVVAVMVFTALIVALIIRNLSQATHEPQMTKSVNAAIQTVATSADTTWYQNENVRKPASVASSIKPAALQQTGKTEKAGSTTSSPPPQSSGMSQEDQQAAQNTLKAMSATINSNQLTSDDQRTNTPTGMPLTGVPSSNSIVAGGEPDQNMQSEKKAFVQTNQQAADSDYLSSTVKNPISPYELQAGTIIPGVLITGINSDLPGQITGQVRSNVYDTISGKHLLIPQGAKLTGLYDSQVAYGQERVLVAWKRIIFPNGQSIDLQGMPGADMSGYAGFNDEVDNRYGKIFGSVFLVSLLSSGATLSQPAQSNNPWATPTVSQTIAQNLGTNIANTGTMITAKNINIQPTLNIRPGYLFNISVTKDMVFNGPYGE